MKEKSFEDQGKETRTKVSIIIPVNNEEKNLTVLYDELIEVMQDIDKIFEIIFVDDGSTDTSLDILRKLVKKDDRVKVVELLSNYGQSTALAAGIKNSRGKLIITMDSDLQHDPKDIIPTLKLLEKYDVVCGWRKERGDSDSFFFKTIPSWISNKAIKLLTSYKLHDSTGGFRGFRRRVVESIPLYGELHRYLPILASHKGFKITEFPIHIRKRKYGKSKYNLLRLYGGFMDLLTVKFFTSYSLRPLHLFGLGGLGILGVGLLGILYVVIRFLQGHTLTSEVAAVVLSVFCIILSAVFFSFGFILDVMAHDSVYTGKRSLYVVDGIYQKKE